MIKRVVLFVALLALGAWVYFGLTRLDPKIGVLNAVAVPMKGKADRFVVSMTLENTGVPDRLMTVDSAAAASAVLVGQIGGLPIVLPSGSKASLASDGLHIVLEIPSSDFPEGSLVPLTLRFQRGGSITTRVIRQAPPPMMHGMGESVSSNPSPTLEFSELVPSLDGFPIRVVTTNFEFKQLGGTGPMPSHKPGEGHAHLYLNGLKLGRMYKPEASIGQLMPGSYNLTVSLNSNDHRAYLANGSPVKANHEFTLGD